MNHPDRERSKMLSHQVLKTTVAGIEASNEPRRVAFESTGESLRESFNQALRWAIIPGLIVYATSLSLSSLAGIKGQLVLRDLAQTCSTPAGVGLLSNLGYLLWLAAAAVALGALQFRPDDLNVLELGIDGEDVLRAVRGEADAPCIVQHSTTQPNKGIRI